MKVTTYANYVSIDDFLNNIPPTSWRGFEHSGPIAELKKGRNQLTSASNAGVANTGTAQGLEQQGQNIANSEIATQGNLSPLVSKQLANERGLIGNAYSGATQAAQRGLANRGMGAAPSGLQSSIANTAINNQGKAETEATGNAFGAQNQLNNTALNIPLAGVNAVNQGVGATTEAGTALNKAGSLAGDIGSGLGGLLGTATGLNKLGGFSGIGRSVWKGGGGSGQGLGYS